MIISDDSRCLGQCVSRSDWSVTVTLAARPGLVTGKGPPGGPSRGAAGAAAFAAAGGLRATRLAGQ